MGHIHSIGSDGWPATSHSHSKYEERPLKSAWKDRDSLNVPCQVPRTLKIRSLPHRRVEEGNAFRICCRLLHGFFSTPQRRTCSHQRMLRLLFPIRKCTLFVPEIDGIEENRSASVGERYPTAETSAPSLSIVSPGLGRYDRTHSSRASHYLG